jgi:hypothetical protein
VQYGAQNKIDYQPQANDLEPGFKGHPTSGKKLLVSGQPL